MPLIFFFLTLTVKIVLHPKILFHDSGPDPFSIFCFSVKYIILKYMCICILIPFANFLFIFQNLDSVFLHQMSVCMCVSKTFSKVKSEIIGKAYVEDKLLGIIGIVI